VRLTRKITFILTLISGHFSGLPNVKNTTTKMVVSSWYRLACDEESREGLKNIYNLLFHSLLRYTEGFVDYRASQRIRMFWEDFRQTVRRISTRSQLLFLRTPDHWVPIHL